MNKGEIVIRQGKYKSVTTIKLVKLGKWEIKTIFFPKGINIVKENNFDANFVCNMTALFLTTIQSNYHCTDKL